MRESKSEVHKPEQFVEEEVHHQYDVLSIRELILHFFVSKTLRKLYSKLLKKEEKKNSNKSQPHQYNIDK